MHPFFIWVQIINQPFNGFQSCTQENAILMQYPLENTLFCHLEGIFCIKHIILNVTEVQCSNPLHQKMNLEICLDEFGQSVIFISDRLRILLQLLVYRRYVICNVVHITLSTGVFQILNVDRWFTNSKFLFSKKMHICCIS